MKQVGQGLVMMAKNPTAFVEDCMNDISYCAGGVLGGAALTAAPKLLTTVWKYISEVRNATRLLDKLDETAYRVLRPDEDLATGLVAKNPGASYSPAAHVRNGSRLETQYISTTRDITVAEKWASKTGNRIAEIDLSSVDGNLLDLSTDAGRLTHLPGNPIAQSYARASAEVLIQGWVPPSAVRLWGG